MSEDQKSGLQLPELTIDQATRVIGGAASILADIINAYVDLAGPHCGDHLLQLRSDLIRNVQNRQPLGLAPEDERAVVQALMVIIEGGFSFIRVVKRDDPDPVPDH